MSIYYVAAWLISIALGLLLLGLIFGGITVMFRDIYRFFKNNPQARTITFLVCFGLWFLYDTVGI